MTFTLLDGGKGRPEPEAAEYSTHAPGYSVAVPTPPKAAVPPAKLMPTLSPVTVLVLQIYRYFLLYDLFPKAKAVPKACELPESDAIEQSPNVGEVCANDSVDKNKMENAKISDNKKRIGSLHRVLFVPIVAWDNRLSKSQLLEVFLTNLSRAAAWAAAFVFGMSAALPAATF